MSEDDIYPLVYLAQLGNNGFPFHLATDELANENVATYIFNLFLSCVKKIDWLRGRIS